MTLYQFTDPEVRQLMAEAAAIGAKEALAASKEFEHDYPATEVMQRLNIKAHATFKKLRQSLKVSPTRMVGTTAMFRLSDFQK
jgi:hypothetical protein